MVIPLKNIKTYAFQWEHNQVVACEKYYTWEMKEYGKVSDNTIALRHHWFERLLARQLKEFDRGL